MRGLFLKIFVIFWIAQSMIFVISMALILRHHFERPDAMFDELNSRLQIDAAKVAGAFEAGGCDSVHAYGASISETLGLENGTAWSAAACAQAGYRHPGGRAVRVASSSHLSRGKPVCLPAGSAAYTTARQLVSRLAAFFVPSTAGCNRCWRVHDVCARAAFHAPHSAPEKGGS
jgi:hypothetical protein